MEDYAETIAKLEDQLKCAETVMRLEAENERLKIELAEMRGAANSYKAEVERLQAEIEEQDQAIINALHRMGEIRAETIREVTERLKDKAMTKYDWKVDDWNDYIEVDEIDLLVREMEKRNYEKIY